MTRLNDVASVELMHSLLMDAVWDTIVQAWIISNHLSGMNTDSSHLNETIRTLLKYRIQIVLVLIVSFRCQEYVFMPDKWSEMIHACTIAWPQHVGDIRVVLLGFP